MNMGFATVINVSNKKNLTQEQRKKASELVERHRKEDSKLVKGIFRDIECPGGDVEFIYRKYKGDDIVKYHFVDGVEYEIPLGVAKHINNNCKYARKQYRGTADSGILTKGSNGQWTPIPGKAIERYQFVSHDFT